MAKEHGISRETASRIWNLRQSCDGYTEDSEEWMDALDVDPDDMRAFECLVAEMINSL